VGKEPVTADIADFGSRVAEYCREIETYLCRKNDGHLIRVTGPSFDLVSGWATQGVPLKVACAGSDCRELRDWGLRDWGLGDCGLTSAD